MDKKILLTTTYREGRTKGYDYGATYMKRGLRFSGLRICSYGLRFIRQNISGVEILEYPTWEEYASKVKEGWDTIGFSFYINEIPEILRMVEHARRAGVREIWGGNYGAMTYGVEKHFDRIFVGYAEEEIAAALDWKVDRIRHPPLIKWVGLPGMKFFTQGMLFTTRGCNLGCAFCQTPSFCSKPAKVPLESIEEVLEYYAGLGITEIIISDEYFGMFPSHSDKVVELLDRYGFYWRCMTRAGYLDRRLEGWSETGFAGAHIGIESFNQSTLDAIGKHETTDVTIDVVKRLHEMHRAILGFYIIGFENETSESIRRDIKKLADLKLDMTQICILTPLPGAGLWNEIAEKYGIFERDWHKFDLHHLVWNHPEIKPDEAEKLLDRALRETHPTAGFFRTAKKLLDLYNRNGAFLGGYRYLTKSIIKANRFDYFPQKIRLL